MKIIKEPNKMLDWIRNNWYELKDRGRLNFAIDRWMLKANYNGLSTDDIVFIEELFPEFLKATQPNTRVSHA